MLLQRVWVALVGIPVLVAAVAIGGLPLTVLLAALAVIGVYEFRNKAKAKAIAITEPLAALVAVGFVLVSHLAAEGLISGESHAVALLALLVLLVFASLAWKVVRYHREPGIPVLAGISATVFAALYVGGMLSVLPLLRGMRGDEALPAVLGWQADYGARLLLLLFLVTWATDTAAYFVGRRFGRRALSPASPNKTVEGAAGGWLCAVLVGGLAGAGLGLPPALGLAAGALAGVTGQIGDLAKSILKRELETKDFGGWLPGHGGMLDRFDSLLFNGPAVYLLVLALR